MVVAFAAAVATSTLELDAVALLEGTFATVVVAVVAAVVVVVAAGALEDRTRGGDERRQRRQGAATAITGSAAAGGSQRRRMALRSCHCRRRRRSCCGTAIGEVVGIGQDGASRVFRRWRHGLLHHLRDFLVAVRLGLAPQLRLHLPHVLQILLELGDDAQHGTADPALARLALAKVAQRLLGGEAVERGAVAGAVAVRRAAAAAELRAAPAGAALHNVRPELLVKGAVLKEAGFAAVGRRRRGVRAATGVKERRQQLLRAQRRGVGSAGGDGRDVLDGFGRRFGRDALGGGWLSRRRRRCMCRMGWRGLFLGGDGRGSWNNGDIVVAIQHDIRGSRIVVVADDAVRIDALFVEQLLHALLC